MSLQGTFDVFSLPEVLRMLAAAHKSGTLIVEASGLAGRIELYEGACCGAAAGGRDDDPIDGPPTVEVLHARLLDVAFEIGREPTGAFRFAGDEPPRRQPSAVAPVEPVLGELELLQEEWRDICTVLPSTEATLVLVARLASDEIVVTAREWAVLALLDGATPVRDLPQRCQESLVEVCRALAALVRRGAVEVATDLGPDVAAPSLLERHPAHLSGPDALGEALTSEFASLGTDGEIAGSRTRRDALEAIATIESLVEPLAPYAPIAAEPDPGHGPSPVALDDALEEALESALDQASDVDVDVDRDGGAGDGAGDGGEDAPDGSQPKRRRDAPAADGDRGAMLRLFSALRE